MSPVISPPPPVGSPEKPDALAPVLKRTGFSPKAILTVAAIVLLAAGITVFGRKLFQGISQPQANAAVPTVRVQRSDLNLTITARGELKGQNPEVLAAPMTGGAELHITSLLPSGTLVKGGDVVVRFDTTEQEYKLREAEADLAEAAQHVAQVNAQHQAQEEEDRYALIKAKNDVTLAELDVRKNPLLATIVARENDLALHAARDHLEQLQKNLTNRAATSAADTAIQEAGRIKAETQAKTARENIEAMTLKAHRAGYVSVERNMGGNFFFFGMTMPFFQSGDSARPGMSIAEIPDLKNWEIEANIGELDRGHIAVGDLVDVMIIAVPNETFSGHVKDIGGTTGPPWDRRFVCRLALDRSSPALRPGMSAQLIITTDRLRKVLWLPAQALFESDGRTFVYVRSGGGFAQRTVKLVQRNETRVVISGVDEGLVVALANPVEVKAKRGAGAPRGPALPN